MIRSIVAALLLMASAAWAQTSRPAAAEQSALDWIAAIAGDKPVSEADRERILKPAREGWVLKYFDSIQGKQIGGKSARPGVAYLNVSDAFVALREQEKARIAREIFEFRGKYRQDTRAVACSVGHDPPDGTTGKYAGAWDKKGWHPARK